MGKGERKNGAAPAADVNEKKNRGDRSMENINIDTYYIETNERKKQKT